MNKCEFGGDRVLGDVMVLRVSPRSADSKNSRPRRLMDCFSVFKRNDEATVTVEFVIWVPVFVMILMLVVDASMLFVEQSNFWGIARDTARRVSINSMTMAQADTWATAEAAFGSTTPDVTVANVSGNVRVTISTPFRNVDVFGIMGLSGLNLVAQVTQRIETP
jgi:Flp pilus assembly protein TadG